MDQHSDQPITQEIIYLYDEYTHVGMARRVFLDRLAKLAGGTAAAAAMLPLLEGRIAFAAMVAPTDSRLDIQTITYPGATGAVRGYLARKKGAGPQPAVVVIHENRGLNPHIEDVTRRLALGGFTAMAPDALSPVGGTPPDQDQARDMIGKLDMKATVNNYVAAVDFLDKYSASTGKVGCVGFCWGGGMANQLAFRASNLDAAVAYYGRTPKSEDVPKIRAALLLHYAGLDKRINAGIPEFEKALKAAGKSYTIHMYEGANHAFNNDTNKPRYNEAAAKLAWGRTVNFLNEKLS